jgi:hypothetical protein
VITAAKISILCLYYSAFAANPTCRRAVRVVGALCILWFVIATFVIVFHCHPIQAYWEELDSSKYCLPSGQILVGYETTNLILDVAILAIPVLGIRDLQLEGSRKITVSVPFMIGAL